MTPEVLNYFWYRLPPGFFVYHLIEARHLIEKNAFVLHLIETVGPRPAAGAAEPGPTVSIKC